MHSSHNHTHNTRELKVKGTEITATIDEPTTETNELKKKQETDSTTNLKTTNATPEETRGVETRSKRKTIEKERADSYSKTSSSNKRRKKMKKERLKQQGGNKPRNQDSTSSNYEGLEHSKHYTRKSGKRKTNQDKNIETVNWKKKRITD